MVGEGSNNFIDGNENGLFIAVRLYLGSRSKIVGSTGLVKLLEEIERTRSIRSAAARAGMNYRKAWNKITTAEKKLHIKLVDRGRGRQGSKLTPEARKLINLYYTVLDNFNRIAKENEIPIKII